jgi:putative transposase
MALKLASLAILRWPQYRRIESYYITQGKPQQNGYVESFNVRLRDESLNTHWFLSLDDGSRRGGRTSTKPDLTHPWGS